MTTEKDRKTQSKSSDYMTNKEFLAEIVACQLDGRVSNKLGSMFMMLATRYATKPNFSGYSYKDEMIAAGVLACVAGYNKFNTDRGTNAFAFFTSVVHNSFLQILNKEKRQQDIRDQILVDEDLNPSHNYLERMADKEKEKKKKEDHQYEIDHETAEEYDPEESDYIDE